MKKKNLALVTAIVVAAGATAWGVQQKGADKPQAGAGAQAPTVVNVVVPQRRNVPVVLLANGTVQPMENVDLHPQTTATIRTVHIKEGQFVKAGDLMFSLDDRSDRANVDKAQAQVVRDQASLADMERQYKRSQELFEQKFIAQSQVDTLKSQVDAARAVLASDQAAAQASRVAAGYTSIRAPLSGRVGAIEVYPGSLVQMTTSLTTITQLNPINVAFTVPESSLAALLAAQKKGAVAVEASTGQAAKAVTGVLSFIDNTVDPVAGTIRVKAQFNNADTSLWPGQYVTTRVTVQTLKDAVVIPQAAIITNTRGTFVYVVDAEQAARSVPVARVYSFGLDAAVTGLNGDEQVITEGKQNLRPGGKVKLAQPAAGAGERKGGRARQGASA
jgi:multidrug efflux system membrane fusion protein